MDPSEQESWDGPLIALAQKSGGDLRKLLYAFFSFLHRRTDFYCIPNEDDVKGGIETKMGFPEGDAEKLLLAAFRQFPLRRMPRQSSLPGMNRSSRAKEVETKALAPSVLSQVEKVSKTKKIQKGNKPRFTEEGKQIPVGNGGSTNRYEWTQTLNEVSVVMGLPENVKAKDLTVEIQPSSVSIRLKKDNTALLEGNLINKVRVDESTWSLEGSALLLTLDKAVKTWWKTVIEGDEEIDTDLVDSTRKISEYDEATQGAIRKIIFDQNQQRLGLPTSDEILGVAPTVPPLPSGVEYIDQDKLDAFKDKPPST